MLRRMILFKMLLLVFMCFAYSMPTDDKENKEAAKEATKSEESKSDEKLEPVEVAKRKAYFRRYGDQDSKKNTQGYRRKSDDQGEDGYKHFDSFHKKSGDRYGYESHSAYGKSKKSKNKGGAASIKYDDKEHDHDGAASRRVYRVINPWHGPDIASYLPHIDIEAIASKFGHHHHHHDDYHFIHRYHDHDQHLELDHYPEHKHHHSYHDDDVEYDHPPYNKDHPEVHHHHVVEDDHDLHHAHHHELDHPPPSYFDHHSSHKLELDHHPGHGHDHPLAHGYDHHPGHELDHHPGHDYDHHPGHDNDHPLAHGHDHHPGHELDHHPGHDHDYLDHHNHKHEYDHPPPGYEADHHHDSKPTDHMIPPELEHPPPDSEVTNKAYLPPPNGGDDSQSSLGDVLDQPPPGDDQTERKDSQIYSSGATSQIAASAGNALNETEVKNQKKYGGIYFGGPFNPDQYEAGRITLNRDQMTTKPTQIPLNIIPSKAIPSQNDENGRISGAFSSSETNTTSQVNTNAGSQLSTLITPNYLPSALQDGQNGQREYTAFSPKNAGVTNYNYKIYFGGLTNPDYQKRYYDLDHWDHTLKEQKINTASSFSLSVNNAENGAYNKHSKTEDSLRDSYGNLYKPIDLRNYLPPLIQASTSGNSNSSEEAIQTNINVHSSNFSGNNDGIFFGGQFNPDEYFGGPIGPADMAESEQPIEENFESVSSVDQNVSKDVLGDTSAYVSPKQNNINLDQLRNLQDHPLNINNALYLESGHHQMVDSQVPVESNIGNSNSHGKNPKLESIFDSIKHNYYLPPLKGNPIHEDKKSSLLNGTGTEEVAKQKEEGRRTSTPTRVEIIPAVEVPLNRSESTDNEVS